MVEESDLEDGHTAHLCIDMQNLVGETGPWQTPWSGRILPTVIALCERYRERTIFTRFMPPPTPGAAIGTWRDFYAKWPQVTGRNVSQHLLDLLPPLAVFAPPAPVIDKMAYSAFSNPALPALLRDWQVSRLILSGVETDVCVLATALAAIDLGYGILIPLDAVCSSSDIGHDALLSVFQTRFSQQIKAVQSADLLR